MKKYYRIKKHYKVRVPHKGVENRVRYSYRSVKQGFSWTVFFFGFFALLFRRQPIPFIISLFTFGLANFYYMFRANKILEESLKKKGFEEIQKEDIPSIFSYERNREFYELVEALRFSSFQKSYEMVKQQQEIKRLEKSKTEEVKQKDNKSNIKNELKTNIFFMKDLKKPNFIHRLFNTEPKKMQSLKLTIYLL